MTYVQPSLSSLATIEHTYLKEMGFIKFNEFEDVLAKKWFISAVYEFKYILSSCILENW